VDQFIDILKLPTHVIPIACIAFGYPANTPELTDKLPLETFIHQEYYHDYHQEDIDRIYKEKESNNNTLKLYAENGMTNLAKIFTEKRYCQKDNEHFARILVNSLKKQGFFEI
jgi:FMN reductase [NAD(P)H]